MGNWREHAAPIIRKVLEENEGKTPSEVKKALYDAYPYGQREYHPYKIWLDEIRVQMGKRRFGVKKEKPDPNQSNLFSTTGKPDNI